MEKVNLSSQSQESTIFLERIRHKRLMGIDLLVLADHSVFEGFMDLTGNDPYSAESAIHQYYSTILNEVCSCSFHSTVPAEVTRYSR